MNIVTTVTVKREHKQLMKKFRNKIIIVNYQPSFKIIKFCKHNLKMVLRQSKKIYTRAGPPTIFNWERKSVNNVITHSR